MKWIIVVTILSCSSVAYSECRIVEYPDHNEAVCDEIPKTEKPSYQKPLDNFLSMDDCNRIKDKIYKLMDEYVETGKADYRKTKLLESKFNALANECSKFNALIQTNSMHDEICDTNLKYILIGLADIQINYAKLLILNDKKKEAKSVLRDLVINFVGFNYKSQVKEAEFMLEDLKATP